MFQKLSKVLTVLTDVVARASYDRWLRAKHAARRRHEELNSKRRRLKEELEQREGRQTVSEVASEREAAASMQKEVCPPLHLILKLIHNCVGCMYIVQFHAIIRLCRLPISAD